MTLTEMVELVEERPVLDHGFIRLDGYMADDLSVVNSARVSFGKRHLEITPDDTGLIRFLMRERHGTPFEHNAVRFHVKLPIFVAREWQRHRIGSFNELSARYTELASEWYIPAVADVRIRVGKPGRYVYKQADYITAVEYTTRLMHDCHRSFLAYKSSLDGGIAPELARAHLHVNHYTEMYWTVNARSMMNFLGLRTAETAQWEIRQYAFRVMDVFSTLMPITAQAFLDNGKVAP